MDQRLTLITLGVSNLKTSLDFYEKKFGWQRTAASNDDIVFFQLNGVMLALFSRESLAEDAHVAAEGNGFRGFTLAYNTRSEAEVDEVVNHLRAHGVPVVKEPQKVFWGGYSSYVSDPDGHLWEIAYNPYLPMDEKGNIMQQ